MDKDKMDKPLFYECGICGAWHSINWNGDCREDAARFNAEDLDELYGAFGWETTAMPVWDDSEE